MAQNDGQILAFTSSATKTQDTLSGLLTPNAGSSFTSYVAQDPNNQSDSGFGVDLVNGLYFKVRLETVGGTQYYALDSFRSDGTLIATLPIGQPSNMDTAGSFVVDPINHLIYAYGFTGTGKVDDKQQNEIYKISYNATSG